ncbi:hypothetical protein QL285_047537 [Trifolium repens]|nr:hypothetical protein QL285_047537 [Trifolium repens]
MIFRNSILVLVSNMIMIDNIIADKRISLEYALYAFGGLQFSFITMVLQTSVSALAIDMFSSKDLFIYLLFGNFPQLLLDKHVHSIHDHWNNLKLPIYCVLD